MIYVVIVNFIVDEAVFIVSKCFLVIIHIVFMTVVDSLVFFDAAGLFVDVYNVIFVVIVTFLT